MHYRLLNGSDLCRRTLSLLLHLVRGLLASVLQAASRLDSYGAVYACFRLLEPCFETFRHPRKVESKPGTQRQAEFRLRLLQRRADAIQVLLRHRGGRRLRVWRRNLGVHRLHQPDVCRDGRPLRVRLHGATVRQVGATHSSSSPPRHDLTTHPHHYSTTNVNLSMAAYGG